MNQRFYAHIGMFCYVYVNQYILQQWSICVHTYIHTYIHRHQMSAKIASIFCNEQIDEKGFCTLLGFYCRVFAFGIGFGSVLFGAIHSKSEPTIATYGIITGVFTMLLESSFLLVHLICFPSVGKFFDSYVSRIFFYSVASIAGIVLHYQKQKEPALLVLFILLGADSILFVCAHVQRQNIEQYRDSGSFGVGVIDTGDV